MERKSARLFIALALALLVLPIWWVFAAVLAAMWHEACHYLALRLCGGQALSLRAGFSGAVMEVQFSGPHQELICSLAGPLGSFSLLLFAKWLPRVAICAGFQGMYNLLPIYPLDGGRAIRCLAEVFFPLDLSCRICLWMERICLFGLIFVSLYGCLVLHLGFAPLLVGAMMICRIKRPCKPVRNSVQWDHKFL